jgi:hypothetical protein
MSQIDAEEDVLSETTDGISEMKLVPVTESIRYRKRAQLAEKKNEVLAEQLADAQKEVVKMSEKLCNVESEQKLTRKLTAAGAVDLEAAMLVAKARIEDSEEADIDGVIEQLKKEKQYLFGKGNCDKVGVVAKRTAPAKNQMQTNQAILERAAKKAATTGSRTDLQEYLKLRRNFV